MTLLSPLDQRSGGPAQGRAAAAGSVGRRGRLARGLTPWLFLAPALVIFTYFKFIPMERAIEMSFYNVRPWLGDEWVGGANYGQVFGDSEFLDAMWHTVVLAVGQTAGSIVIGLALALLLEGQARHLWFVRTAVFLPTVAAMAVVAEVWRILYYPGDNGIVNMVLGWFGAGPSQFIHNEHTSLVSVMVVGIWRGAPYDMMIFLAGLAGVDRNLYESAAVDGAGVWRRLWHVAFPALRPVFAILFTLAAIRGLRVFTEVYVLTGGGPNHSTEVMMTLIVTRALGVDHDFGVAAAGSVVLLGATIVLTLAVRAARRLGRDR